MVSESRRSELARCAIPPRIHVRDRAGTGKDLQRAVSLYCSAADSGYPDAQNLLGFLYATGSDGLPHDDNQAVDWYRKAAEKGFAKAEKNLGDMYFFGHGVSDQDYGMAISWNKKAADQNFAEAQFRLGFMYEKGLGELRKAISRLPRSINEPPATGA